MRFRLNEVTLAGVALLLASCGTVDGKNDNHPREASRPQSRPSGHPTSDMPVKIGNPYQVKGVTYTPGDPVSYDEVGYASWYGEEQNGNPTANGESFFADAVAAAHRTLPLPSYVEVTALDTGKTILVRVNDRGPFSNDRLIDLSRGAAEQLGIMGHGSVAVRVRRVNPPEQERATLRAGGRAAERLETPRPLLVALRARLNDAQPQAVQPPPPAPKPAIAKPIPAKPAPPPKPLVASPAKPTGGYVVQIAAFSSEERARALANRIGANVVKIDALWRVRFGPYPSRDAARTGVTRAASEGFRDARIVAIDG